MGGCESFEFPGTAVVCAEAYVGNGAPKTEPEPTARRAVAREHPTPELTPILEWLRRDCGASSTLVVEFAGDRLYLLGVASPPDWLETLLTNLPRNDLTQPASLTTSELGIAGPDQRVDLIPMDLGSDGPRMVCLITGASPVSGRPDQPDDTTLAALREHLRRLARDRGNARVQTAHLAQADVLQDSLDALDEPLTTCDDGGRILAANAAACRMLEGRLEDLLGRPVDRILGSDATAFMEHLRQRPIDDSLPQQSQWRLRDMQGRELEVTVQSTATAANRRPPRLLLRWRQSSRERSGELLRDARAMILERVARREPVTTTLAAICELAAGHWPETLAIVSVPWPDGDRLLVAPDMPRHFRQGLEDHHEFDPAESLCATVAATGQRQICPDVRAEDRWPDYSWFAVAHGIHAIWGEPLRGREGSTLGVLTLFRRQPGPPDSSQLETIRQLAELASVAVSHAEFLDELESQAFHDGLTGLANRRLLSDRLAHQIGQARRTQRPVAVLLLDVDGFKEVNDRHGHEVGDELLCHLGRRFSNVLRPGDTLARLGGDEFVVVAPLGRPTDATIIAEKLISASESVTTDPPIGLSVGISLFPDHGDGERPLLHRADRAMYQAKRQGKHRWCVYADPK